MPKLTAKQSAILEALRNGARIEMRGIGMHKRWTLCVPCDGSYHGTETVRDETLRGLLAAKAIWRIGSDFCRDRHYVAA